MDAEVYGCFTFDSGKSPSEIHLVLTRTFIDTDVDTKLGLNECIVCNLSYFEFEFVLTEFRFKSHTYKSRF